MNRKNITLISIFIALSICLSLTACSSGEEEENSSQESDMPQISVDMSESAQTTPESTPENTPENTVTAAPETSETQDTESDKRIETSLTDAETIVSAESPAESTDESVSDSTPTPDGAAVINGIAELAAALDGKPFYFGGADPETGFDNSGLMYYVLQSNGIDCPRLTKDIAAWGEKAAYEELLPGYLVFFEYEGSGKADFGGIYIGDGKMVVSTDENKPVSTVDITTPYYQRTFQFGIKTF